MIITLHTEGWFDASHHLENYEGKCANEHGHTYRVRVWCKGDEKYLDKAGILWDFGNLKALISPLDHTDLNKFFTCNPTAENMVVYFYKTLKEVNKHLKFKVRLYEQIAPKELWAEVGDFE